MSMQIKQKPRAWWPFVSSYVQHHLSVSFIEWIVCINEENFPVFIFELIHVPKGSDLVHSIFHSYFQATTKLVNPTCSRSFWSCCRKHHFTKRRLRMSPTPIRCTPRHSSRPTSVLINKALHAAKGGHVLENYSIRLAVILRKIWLAPPCFNN